MTADGPDPEEFTCERCGEDTDDTSYQPLCPDCYWETHQNQDPDEGEATYREHQA